MADNPVSRYLETLRQSQWASVEELGELQRSLLTRLVLHAAQQTEGYAERLAPVTDGRNVRLQNWHQLPFLTRKDLQDRQHLFRARETPTMTGGVVSSATSGSTGRVMEFVKSPLLTQSSRAVVERAHDWANADRDLNYVTIAVDRKNIAPPPDGKIHSPWSWDGGRGQHAFLSIAAPLSVQVEFLDRHRPAYLRTYPTNAAALASHAGGLPWHENLRHVFTFAETLTDDQADVIREKLGVEITDFYASEEAGQLATRCPHSGYYHVAIESVLLEVLRPDNTPCGPGETGRIVVTPFYNYALPLIRYEQDDLAELPHNDCGCGRNLPVLKRILGRTRDMFVLPNGDRIWPQLRPPAVLKHLPAVQWQAVQTARDLIEIRYVHDGSDRQASEGGMRSYIHERFGSDVGVALVEVNQIERSSGGKFREFISLVE